MRYQRKTLSVFAIQWTGMNVKEVFDFIRDMHIQGMVTITFYSDDVKLTIEEEHKEDKAWWLMKYDYVVLDYDGKFNVYPSCAFSIYFEPVDDSDIGDLLCSN